MGQTIFSRPNHKRWVPCRLLLLENSGMAKSNDLECFILLFYHVSIVVCLGVVYEYASILVILIDTIF
jgi:hypothetical protein